MKTIHLYQRLVDCIFSNTEDSEVLQGRKRDVKDAEKHIYIIIAYSGGNVDIFGKILSRAGVQICSRNVVDMTLFALQIRHHVL